MSKLALFSQKLFEKHNTRMWRKEKDAFLETSKAAFADLGYDEITIKEDKNQLGITSRNLLVGKADADIFITAHYDTPGRNGILMLLTPIFGSLIGSIVLLFPLFFLVGVLQGSLMIHFDSSGLDLVFRLATFAIFALFFFVKNPKNHNDNTSGVLGVYQVAKLVAENPQLKERVAFLLFDHEEVLPGLLGSKAFAKWRRKTYPNKTDTKVINLDCIGQGDVLTVMVKTDHPNWHHMADFMTEKGYPVKKARGGLAGNSDHASFPGGVSLLFQKKSLLGPLYIPKIHTGRDKICNLDQIEQLGEAVYQYIQ